MNGDRTDSSSTRLGDIASVAKESERGGSVWGWYSRGGAATLTKGSLVAFCILFVMRVSGYSSSNR